MISTIADVIGRWPYRLVLAGGWIDQPFVNVHNPDPPGSMVVVSLEPVCRFMERSGLATSTRRIAQELWPEGIPARDPALLVQELYEAENKGATAPSGSQDMAGLIYPGILRLDYDCGATYPSVISLNDSDICAWLQSVLWLLPVCPRPAGYDPVEVQRLVPAVVSRLGENGRDCFDAIGQRDLARLGNAMTNYEITAAELLPCHLSHHTLTIELRSLWEAYALEYPGATYSGPGGGYLIVASDRPVPGAFQIQIRWQEEGQ